MGKKSRDKGKVGERELAAALRALGIEARRGRQFQGGDDSPDVVTALPGVSIECKRTERFQIWAALKQAQDDAGAKIPVVLTRRNRSPWVLCVELEHLPTLSAIVQAVVGGRGE